MYIVDRIENDYVILEYKGNYIEIKKELLPDVNEQDVLYLENNIYVKNIKDTEKRKKVIRNRFNKLKG